MDDAERFIGYVLKTCSTLQELADRSARDRHNRAMRSLYRLQRDKMYAAPDRSADAAWQLMAHPEARVRLSAAAYCLKAEVHQEQARACLQQLHQDGPTALIRLNAEMCAMCCVPFSRQSTADQQKTRPDADGGKGYL